MGVNLFLQIFLVITSPVMEMTNWVRSQFQLNSSPEIHAYYGHMADHLPFVMVIGQNENEVVGTYKFQYDTNQFYLLGDIDDSKISLVESTKDDLSSGYFFVTQNQDTVEGYWTNYNTKSKIPVTATRIKSTSTWDWPTENNWVKQFYGQYSGRRIELLIQKEHDVISGTLYSADLEQSFFLNGYCVNDSCTKLEVSIFDELENPVGEMTGQFFQKNVIFINYRQNDQPSAFYSLPIRRSVDFISKPQLSFQSIQDFTYPDLEGLYDRIDEFYNRRSKHHVEESRNLTPTDRLSTIQNGWIDIHWMNNRVITASLIYHDNILNEPFTEMINYDIKKNEIVVIDELFKKKSNYQQTISKLIKDRLKKDGNPYKLSEKDFVHIGLIKDGILVTSDFDILNGQAKYILPFSHFENQLAKHPILNYYYKSN